MTDQDKPIVIDTPDGIKAFAMLQVIGALSVEVNTGMRFSRGLSILQVAQRRYGIKAKRKPAALQELRKLYADTFGVETNVGKRKPCGDHCDHPVSS